ncbi:hypothetical protein H5410_024963 [Solanum commersonii]|uniref:DUF4283 domain-containing protein n=1 Tax=Solanum commersonii TaxID=4109 RepID=A0A9J5YUJ8_SOLCO|nr:hypothetical protein H5410_024963 [Solanum commersonii]
MYYKFCCPLLVFRREMDNKIFFKLGGKSYDLTDTNLASDSRFEWVESVGWYVRRMKLSREMGDQCGGWIEAEEETQLKNHLRWARIRVKGPLKEISAYVEVSDGEFNFSLPVWCEAPARFRRN